MNSKRVGMMPYRETAATLTGVKGKGFLADIREASFARFRTVGFPTQKHENWRYLNLEPILAIPFVAPLTSPNTVTVTAPAGAIVTTITPTLVENSEDIRPYLIPDANQETNAFVALNAAHFERAPLLTVPPGVELTQPIEMTIAPTANLEGPTVFYPRAIVVLKPQSKAEIAIKIEGMASSPFFVNAVIDLFVEDAAQLDAVQIQHADDRAIHFLTVNLHLGARSRVTYTTAVQGGRITRNEYRSTFAGEGAEFHLNGTSLLTGKSRAYHHVHVDHRAPYCIARQLQKNIVSGESLVEWNSLVHIHHGAVGSDSNQLNRNIVLSRDARAITRPQLKVFNEDVKANHGATVGQLDDRELFYLRSRGIRKEAAYAMLLHGFAEEAIQGVTSPALLPALDRFVQEELRRVAGVIL